MIEAYIEYWGLEQHPFLLAPDSQMMYMAGQYYECLERLKYAINTNKGGVLVVSEDAGLGKTTMLLKLIEEMKQQYGHAFKYALVDHPTLDPPQMISYITGCISEHKPQEDKLKNILMLKDALIEVKQQGGKSIIIVDEGQMLCGAHDVLQELRVLINLNYNNEYLHTFILSGQRPLWEEVKSLPEFWQRLPVRYYFVPLKLEETKELVRFRLKKAGLKSDRRIFSDDALEMIQRYSKGSPRTIIALADLSLLIGYTDHTGMIGFKEVSKAINAMSGRGESLPYIREGAKEKRTPSYEISVASKASGKGAKKMSDDLQSVIFGNEPTNQLRPFFIVLAGIFLILLGALSYHYLSGSGEKKEVANVAVKKDAPKEASNVQQEQALKPAPQQEEKPPKEIKVDEKPKTIKEAVVIKQAANIRSAPDMLAPRVGMIFEGEIIKISDERKDSSGGTWYRFTLYGDKEGWISESVVRIR